MSFAVIATTEGNFALIPKRPFLNMVTFHLDCSTPFDDMPDGEPAIHNLQHEFKIKQIPDGRVLHCDGSFVVVQHDRSLLYSKYNNAGSLPEEIISIENCKIAFLIETNNGYRLIDEEMHTLSETYPTRGSTIEALLTANTKLSEEQAQELLSGMNTETVEFASVFQWVDYNAPENEIEQRIFRSSVLLHDEKQILLYNSTSHSRLTYDKITKLKLVRNDGLPLLHAHVEVTDPVSQETKAELHIIAVKFRDFPLKLELLERAIFIDENLSVPAFRRWTQWVYQRQDQRICRIMYDLLTRIRNWPFVIRITCKRLPVLAAKLINRTTMALDTEQGSYIMDDRALACKANIDVPKFFDTLACGSHTLLLTESASRPVLFFNTNTNKFVDVDFFANKKLICPPSQSKRAAN